MREEQRVQRYLCSKCRKTITVMNEDMLPNKHYAASEVDSTLEDEGLTATGAEESTIRRWTNDAKVWMIQALGKLEIYLYHKGLHPGNLPSHGLTAFRHLLSLLPRSASSLFKTTIEYIYWLSHHFRVY
jgi:hypothetical protein